MQDVTLANRHVWDHRKFLDALYEGMTDPMRHFGQPDPDSDWNLLCAGKAIPFNINIADFTCAWTQDNCRPGVDLEILDELLRLIFGAGGGLAPWRK